MKYKIYNQDVRQWAKEYKGEKFHALFADAPYELAFMGKSWDSSGVAFDPETWRALAEHLYPGAFLFVYAGTMNDDLISYAMRRAGLEKFHSAKVWNFASGFPKATRIDVAIDRAAGVQREIIGKIRRDAGSKSNHAFEKCRELEFDVTAPATPLAKAWSGHRYGKQSLKPAIENIIIARKPFSSEYEVDLVCEDIDLILENLWSRFAVNAEKTLLAEREVNIALKVAQTLANKKEKNFSVNDVIKNFSESILQLEEVLVGFVQENAKTLNSESISTVKTVAKKSTRPQQSSNVTMIDIVTENAIPLTTRTKDAEYANNVGKSISQTKRTDYQNIVRENVDINQNQGHSLITRFEMGIDINTAMAMLLSISEKVRLDLSMIWLWKIVWDAVCEEVSKYITGTESKMITELRILNCSLRKVMLEWQDTVLEKNLSEEHRSYAADAIKCFSGLLTCLKELDVTVNRANLETVLIFQKPYEGRPIDSITKNGAGALNIESGRISCDSRPLREGTRDLPSNGIYQEGVNGSRAAGETSLGRWPANFFLTHSISCVQLDKDDWQCVEQCPVRKLGEQSGDIKVMPSSRNNREQTTGMGKGLKSLGNGLVGYDDSGTASRFFHNASWQLEVLEQIERADEVQYCAKAGSTEKELGLRDGGVGALRDGGRLETMVMNNHPCVKPAELNRHLATLLIPPKEYAPRRILIPFSGVASEMIGAILAGWDEVVGIESDTEHGYIKIAEARLAWWVDKFEKCGGDYEKLKQWLPKYDEEKEQAMKKQISLF